MKFPIRTVLAAAAVLWPSVALAQISGPARVIDGDTIDVGGTRIRLYGIDAPEKRQTCEGSEGQVYECGRDASAVMAELTVGHTVDCEPQDQDRYGRTVAICSNESGDIGAAMVRRGWAVPYMRYGGSRYLNEQSEAQQEKLGMWSGRFQMPDEFRRSTRRRGSVYTPEQEAAVRTFLDGIGMPGYVPSHEYRHVVRTWNTARRAYSITRRRY